jgi:hypothetical protein
MTVGSNASSGLQPPSRMFCATKTANPQEPAANEAPKGEHEEKKPMTFGRFFLYATAGVSGSMFLYYFYQSGFNLHKTEIAISRKLAELPFYWPPGPGEAEVNTSMPQVEISQSVIDQISAWFIYQDTALKDGVRRSDVLDLLSELGLVDPEKEGDTSFNTVGDEEFRTKIAKLVSAFIDKGRGRLTEYKRLSGVSLQDTVKLLNDIVLIHLEINPQITEKVAGTLDGILEKLVETQQSKMLVPGMALAGKVPAGEVLPEVEAGDKEILEMELSQLEKSRNDLKDSNLSDAEKARLVTIESQITEVKRLLKNF